MKEISKFTTDLESGKYLYFGHEINVISVFHKDGDSGKKTWIKAEFIDSKGLPAKVETTADIIKKMLGIATKGYNTNGQSKCTKVLTDDELSVLIDNKSSDLFKPIYKYLGEPSLDDEDSLQYTILDSIRAAVHDKELSDNEVRKAKRAQETANKAAKAIGESASADDIELMIKELERQKAALIAAQK